MTNYEVLKPFDSTKEQKKTPESAESKVNKQTMNVLNTLVPKDGKYGTYKYENPKNPKEKYNVGVQKLRDGFSVLLMDPAKPNMVLKGVFKLNKKPEFFQLNMEKQQGMTKKENQKKMPSNPQVAKNFMAIVGEINKIELTKKQGN